MMKSVVAFFCIWALLSPIIEANGHKDSEHHHKSEARKHASHHFGHRSFFHHKHSQNRDNGITCICTDSNGNHVPLPGNGTGTGLLVLYKESESLLVLVNITGKALILADYSSGALVLQDGQSGSTTIILVKEQVLVQIKSNSSNWNDPSQNIGAFLASLQIKPILDLAQQYEPKYNLSNVNDEVLNAIAAVVARLNVGQNISCQESLNLILKYSENLVSSHDGSLKGYIRGSGAFIINAGIQSFSGLVKGLQLLVEDAPGGLQAILKQPLDIPKALNASSGLEVLLNILVQIGAHQDLAQLFGSKLNNPEKLLEIAHAFGGGKVTGLDGIVNVIYRLVILFRDPSAFRNLIQAVIEFNKGGGFLAISDEELKRITDDALELSSSQNRLFHNAQGLTQFTTFLKSLNDDSVTINGVQIAEIVNLLRKRDYQNGIDLITKILTRCGERLRPDQSIPRFINHILELLNSTQGGNIVSNLFPGLNISQLTSGGNPLQSILHGSNLTQILSGGNGTSQLFERVPFIGSIFKQISQSLHGGGFSIERLFNASSIISSIQNIFGGASGGSFVSIIQNATSSIGGSGGFGGAISSGIQGVIEAFGGGSISGGVQSGNTSTTTK